MGWLETTSQIWEVCSQILGSISQHVGYVRDLNDNVTTLTKETGKLKRKRDEVEDEVNAAESVGKKRRCDVGDWLQDVDEIVAEVDSIQSEFGRKKTNPLSRYKLGKRVVEKIEVVKTLRDKRIFDQVAKSPRCPLTPEFPVPIQLEQQSTSQATLQEIEQALSDEEIGIVSVCGMGGIGKTTLMQKIYNSVAETGDFNVLIWVTVSEDLNLEVIQKRIVKELDMEFRDDEGIEYKRRMLHARLRNERYMLILDDLWQKISLDHIGIPQPDKENRCKIAITTRSVEVGNGMEVDRVIRVKTLSSVEAWELFRSKTGDVVLQPEIQTLAEEVVRECGGLPLAIKTVGGAMRRKRQKELWQNALRALRAQAAPEVPGMEREVFLPLKLSYDCLEDPEIQSCFLYCSLYPEDYEIFIADLFRYWAFEEGLINNVSSLDDAVNKGYGIIERLRDACLLEDGPQGDEYVWMHDLLRDLAIWITSPSSSSFLEASSSCLQASNPLVKAGKGLEQPPEDKMWEGTQRISLMRNHIKELQMTPNCPDLVSLSIRENFRLRIIHNSFFELMPKLQILDLKRTYIKSLPPSLSQLVNLRVLDASQCENLHDVPPLGHLRELQFLDLSGTGIESLPQGIASLAKLRSLELSETKAPATIPRGIISGLTSLEDLGLYSHWQMMSKEIWREVATLPRLTNLRIMLPSLDAFSPDDKKHPMWSRLSRFLVQFGHSDESYFSTYLVRLLLIFDCEEFPIQINGLKEKAEQLIIQPCRSSESLSQKIGGSTSMREAGENNALDRLEKPSLKKAFDGGPPKGFQQLKTIRISGCDKLRCIFSSRMLQHLHPLESLTLNNCEGIVEIVEGGQLPDTALQRLKYLRVEKLPKLERISISARQISISACHRLRCIFSSSMLRHLHPLESLTVEDCEETVEIVEGGPLPDTALQRLRDLSLKELPKLERISIFASQISISACHKLKCVFSSSMLQHLHPVERLTVKNCKKIVEIVEGGPLPDTALQRLRNLTLHGLPKLERISVSACEIFISACHKLRCIFSSSMLQHLHLLESLSVYNCQEIVEIVEGGPLPDTQLHRLRYPSLEKLPKLTAICSQQLVLTSMEEISMEDCPELKKLPVLCSGLQEIRGVIDASREWWEGIEWENEHSKSLYSTIYEETEAGDNVEEASEMENDEEASEPEPAKEAEAASEL